MGSFYVTMQVVSRNTAALLGLVKVGLVTASPLSIAESPLINSDGTIGIKAGSKFADFCLRNKGGKVKLQPCKSKKERYQWTVAEGSHHIVSAFDDTCWEANLDVHGDKIMLAACDESNQAQQVQFDHGNIMQVHSSEMFCVTLSKNLNLKMKKCVYNKFGGNMRGNMGNKEDDDEHMGDEAMPESTGEPESEEQTTESPMDMPNDELVLDTDMPMTYDPTSMEASQSDLTFPFVQTQANVGRDAAHCYELQDGLYDDYESVSTCCNGGNSNECYDNAACSSDTGTCLCLPDFYMDWNEQHGAYECFSCSSLFFNMIEDGERDWPLADVKQKAGCEGFEPTTTYPIITTEMIEEHMGGALAPGGRMIGK